MIMRVCAWPCAGPASAVIQCFPQGPEEVLHVGSCVVAVDRYSQSAGMRHDVDTALVQMTMDSIGVRVPERDDARHRVILDGRQ